MTHVLCRRKSYLALAANVCSGVADWGAVVPSGLHGRQDVVAYPEWIYYPSHARPPDWVPPFLGGRGSRAAAHRLHSVESLTSDRVLEHLRPGLEALGFEVLDAGVTLTIAGEPETFERVLGLRPEVRRDAAPGESPVTPTGRLRLPDELDGLVETVVFPERPHLFR